MKQQIKRAVVATIGYQRFLRLLRHVRVFQERIRPGEFSALSKVIRPGSAVLDIGANIGYTAACFARRASLVLAVEPDSDNFACLKATAPLNVRPISCAVGSHCGTVSLSVPVVDGVKQHALGRVVEGGVVPMLTVDNLAEGLDVGLVKIDVEGFEAEALAGMSRTLTTKPPIYVEICGSANVTAWAGAADTFGYAVTSWDGHKFEPTPLDRSGNFLLYVSGTA